MFPHTSSVDSIYLKTKTKKGFWIQPAWLPVQGEEQRLTLAQEGAARAVQDAKEAQAIAASERKRYTNLLCSSMASLVMTH